MGSSPSATFNPSTNQIYVAFKSNDSSNLVDLATSPDGVNFTFSAAAQASHTSTDPSATFHNGILYIGFRQNDPNSHAFFYCYSTDGVNFSGPILVNWSMGGPPMLFNSPSNLLYNVFRQNDTPSYLFSSHAP
jgi:hypothetical protein